MLELVADGVLVEDAGGPRPPITSRPMAPILPLAAKMLARPRSARSGRAAGRARSCSTMCRSASGCWKPTSGRWRRSPTSSKCAKSARSTCHHCSRSLTLLFDPEHALDERIAMEQFAH